MPNTSTLFSSLNWRIPTVMPMKQPVRPIPALNIMCVCVCVWVCYLQCTTVGPTCANPYFCRHCCLYACTSLASAINCRAVSVGADWSGHAVNLFIYVINACVCVCTSNDVIVEFVDDTLIEYYEYCIHPFEYMIKLVHSPRRTSAPVLVCTIHICSIQSTVNTTHTHTHTRTLLFSFNFVIITIIAAFSCHTIDQKSSIVFGSGPCVAMNAIGSSSYPYSNNTNHPNNPYSYIIGINIRPRPCIVTIHLSHAGVRTTRLPLS
jgi:hypothetical protein